MGRFNRWSSSFSARLLLLTAALGGVGVTAVVGGWYATSRSRSDTPAEMGKWLLTLSTALLVTGAVTLLVKFGEERRSEREFWHDALREAVAASDSLTAAGRIVNAHKSAKTYREQHDKLLEVRAAIRRLGTDYRVRADSTVRDGLDGARKFLTEFAAEYSYSYERASQQQKTDEARAKSRARWRAWWWCRQKQRENVWDVLTNEEYFPKLAVLRADEDYVDEVIGRRARCAEADVAKQKVAENTGAGALHAAEASVALAKQQSGDPNGVSAKRVEERAELVELYRAALKRLEERAYGRAAKIKPQPDDKAPNGRSSSRN